MLKRMKKKTISLYHSAVLLFLVAVPVSAEAATLEKIIINVTNWLQGPVAKSAGILAIICSGYLTMVSQRLPKEVFMLMLVGLGLIFGASSLYTAWIA